MRRWFVCRQVALYTNEGCSFSRMALVWYGMGRGAQLNSTATHLLVSDTDTLETNDVVLARHVHVIHT